MKRLLSKSLTTGIIVLIVFWLGSFLLNTTPISEEQFEDLYSCTSILVGKLASVDGSTMTSHTCDSNSDRTWINIVPRQKHNPGDMCVLYFQPKQIKGPDHPDKLPRGRIPQIPETNAYINTCYPVMNEYQLAIGETTIGQRPELKSKEGIVDAPELFRLVLERAKTAREAIKVADEISKEFGYIDTGECFTFADPNEVWHFEIFGPGKGKKGAVWAAQRIPDDHVGMSSNSSRIRQIDLKNKDYFMASSNIHSLAIEMGWWNPKSGKPFEVCYAYHPKSRTHMSCRPREWRVLSLVAPSLKLDYNSENYPFSVKPEKKLSVQDLLAIFRDTYGGTEHDMTRNLTVVNKKGETIKSPVATPFMSEELRELLKVKRERTISHRACTYLQITQSRDWLPDMIGGVVWLGYDNPAATPHTPFYCGISRMPNSYRVGGRSGFNRESAWWAFRRASKLAQFRWQHMKQDMEKVWSKIEEDAFLSQQKIEEEAVRLYKEDPQKAKEYLTKYCVEVAENAVEAYWKLGDNLWSIYSRYF